MKEYRHYMCDFGHQWTLFKNANEPEIDSDCLCPEEGHEAVTMTRKPALDDVQIIFRPAVRIVDPVKGQVAGRGRYYLVITDLDGQEERISRISYTWVEVCHHARNFHNRSLDGH